MRVLPFLVLFCGALAAADRYFPVPDAQGEYDPRNTGLDPVPESVFRYDNSREGWKPGTALAYEETCAETLRLVLAAVRSN